MAKTKKSAIQILNDRIKKQFDVEYVGGVGFCGPRWAEAQAEWDKHKEVALDATFGG